MRYRYILKSFISIIILLVLLCSCSNATNEFWIDKSKHITNDIQEVKPITDEEMEQIKRAVNIVLGERSFSENYNKNEIIRPFVKSEETVDGELWFPPINNSTPLEEIAPTISYELMCDGLYISPFYPDNPEHYTAQALNENAFPIVFFRKVNDLYYYTACKVENGGYIYYFFMAKSNVTVEEAAKVYDDMIEYDKWGNMIIENPYHLYNYELADLTGIDLTKEVIWRGSIYSAKEILSVDDLANSINSIGQGDDNFDRSIKYYFECDPNFDIVTDIMPKLYYNISDNKDTSFSIVQNIYSGLMPLCNGAPRFNLLGKDGVITIILAPSMKNGLYDTTSISELTKINISEYVQLNSAYTNRRSENLWSKVFNYSDSSYTWYVTEDNSILLEILPQDYKY